MRETDQLRLIPYWERHYRRTPDNSNFGRSESMREWQGLENQRDAPTFFNASFEGASVSQMDYDKAFRSAG